MSIADKLTQIAENEQAVFEAGKESERKVFWGAFQNNGNRTDYRYAFAGAGAGWTVDNFKPMYNVHPTTDAREMFRDSRINADLGAILNECGVTLNFSGCTRMEYAFYNTYFAVLPEIDLSGATATGAFDYSAKLVTISNLIVSDTTTAIGISNCTALKNITITGTIANSLWIASSPLTKASIESIIGALSGTVTGKTLTVNAAAKQAAFTDSEWAALIGTKPNWTIS